MANEYAGATPQGMLRGSANDKRVERETVDTGTGTKRLAGNRAEHMSRGNFVNFYDDLGISATSDRADVVRQDEATFQGKVAEQKGILQGAQSEWNSANSQVQSAQGEVDQANKELDKAASEIPGYQEAYDKAFSAYKSQNLANVAIVNPNNQIEAYYAVPAATVYGYAETGQFYINPASDGVTYISTAGKGGEHYGNDLHVGFGTAALQVENEFSKQAAPQIAAELSKANSSVQSQQNELSSAYRTVEEQQGQLDVAQSKIDSSRSVLQSTEASRAKQWADIHATYEKRKNTMREIFGGFKVE